MGWLPDHIWRKQNQQKTGKGNWLPDHIWLKQNQQKTGKGNWLPDHIWKKQKNGMAGGKSFGGRITNNKDKFNKTVDASCTVWVGGIPEGTTYSELKEHVDQVLPCKWAEVYTGKGKGSGLIGFASQDEAASAITMLSGLLVKGEAVEVDAYAKAKTEEGGTNTKKNTSKGNWLPDHIWLKQKQQKTGKGGGKSFGSKVNPSCTVWVGGLPEATTYAELKLHVDDVLPCKWTEVYTGKGKGSGLIGFATEDDAASAITMLNGSVLNGVAIEVDAYTRAKA